MHGAMFISRPYRIWRIDPELHLELSKTGHFWASKIAPKRSTKKDPLGCPNLVRFGPPNHVLRTKKSWFSEPKILVLRTKHLGSKTQTLEPKKWATLEPKKKATLEPKKSLLRTKKGLLRTKKMGHFRIKNKGHFRTKKKGLFRTKKRATLEPRKRASLEPKKPWF